MCMSEVGKNCSGYLNPFQQNPTYGLGTGRAQSLLPLACVEIKSTPSLALFPVSCLLGVAQGHA